MPARLVLPTVALAALVGAGCSADVPPPEPPQEPAPLVGPAPPYDDSLEPAEAVLAFVPATATTVTVTDFDEVRAQLGVPDLTSDDLMTDRFAFWERADAVAPLLTEGLLRPYASELWLDHDFSQDDVDWEARFTGPDGSGFVLGMRPDLDLDRVAGAIEAGVGPLADAELLRDAGLVVSGVPEPEEPVWANDEAWAELLPDDPAAATYLRQGCVPLEQALGPDADAEVQGEVLAAVPVTSLDELDRFAVAFGDNNATVRLGSGRDDLFTRVAAGRAWPVPDFGRHFRDGVGDPGTGRIGYAVPDPPRAARLTLLEELPFAICPDVLPIPEPTGL
ncbi:hypothetical protein ACFP3Q_17555 [Nocardioides sp. GCM10027113]|uniref:hypothetical protein n=1 Tax=unclassified Nocardioides TaxID=2615069 RepID=UPI003616000E